MDWGDTFFCNETQKGVHATDYLPSLGIRFLHVTDTTTISFLLKVDFFWINRDQRSFEWFVSLLNQLEMEQSEQGGFDRFLDMHMYMTSALRKTDVKAIGLQMALDLIHKKQKRDLITGLKTKTQAGRPDWEKVCKSLLLHPSILWEITYSIIAGYIIVQHNIIAFAQLEHCYESGTIIC